MKLTLVDRPSLPPSASPYRLLDEQGQEVAWANTFLDAQRIRQLSLRSLRAYAYDGQTGPIGKNTTLSSGSLVASDGVWAERSEAAPRALSSLPVIGAGKGDVLPA